MATNLDQYKTQPVYKTDAYLGMFKSLLPRGLIWGFNRMLTIVILQDVVSGDTLQDTVDSTDVIQDVAGGSTQYSDTLFGNLLSCFASETARFEDRFWALVREAVPGLSVELLPQHEQQLGLPETCTTGVQTLAERQSAAQAKQYDEYKTTTKQFFIDYAATLGFTITFETDTVLSQPRIMGSSRMGASQPRMGGRGAYSTALITVTAGDGTLEQLQCTFRRIKQAHDVFVWVDAR